MLDKMDYLMNQKASMADILKRLRRKELDIIARKLKLKDYKQYKKKAELISKLKETYTDSLLETALKITRWDRFSYWWDKYQNNVFGWCEIIGILLAIFFYFFPFSSEQPPSISNDQSKNEITHEEVNIGQIKKYITEGDLVKADSLIKANLTDKDSALINSLLQLKRIKEKEFEREKVLNKLNGTRAGLTDIEFKMRLLSGELENRNSTVRSLEQVLRDKNWQLENLQHDLSIFVSDHQGATLALAAGEEGIKSLVDENVDSDTKNAMNLVVLAVATYCLFNFSECNEVSNKLNLFNSSITTLKTSIEGTESEIATEKSMLYSKQSEYDELNKQYANKNDLLNSYMRVYESLK